MAGKRKDIERPETTQDHPRKSSSVDYGEMLRQPNTDQLRGYRSRGRNTHLFGRLVGFDQKDNIGGRQMKRIGGQVAGGLTRSGSLPMGTLFSPDLRETRLQRSSKLLERGIEIVGEKTVATHDVEKI